MEVAVPPVMEADADLKDPVIQGTYGCAGISPQQLDRLVLVEELAGVELLDAVDQLGGRRLVTSGSNGFVDLTAGDALWRPRRLSVAATASGRGQGLRSCGSAARLP